MKKASVIYLQEYEATPLSFWVHRHLEADARANANQFDPPVPDPVPGRGWAQLVIEFDGVTLRLSSSARLRLLSHAFAASAGSSLRSASSKSP
jgi:hypothetical protein